MDFILLPGLLIEFNQCPLSDHKHPCSCISSITLRTSSWLLIIPTFFFEHFEVIIWQNVSNHTLLFLTIILKLPFLFHHLKTVQLFSSVPLTITVRRCINKSTNNLTPFSWHFHSMRVILVPLMLILHTGSNY